MDQTLTLRIREHAYHIWAANGGEAEQNWLRAETEILNNSAAQPPHTQLQRKRLGTARGKTKKTASAALPMRLATTTPPTAESALHQSADSNKPAAIG